MVIITQLHRDKNYVPLIMCLDNYKELLFFIISFGACEVIFVNRSRKLQSLLNTQLDVFRPPTLFATVCNDHSRPPPTVT